MSLIDHARRVADAVRKTRDDDFEDVIHPADDAGMPHVEAGLRGCRDARDALPAIALLDALGPAGVRRIQAAQGLALVVKVPTPDWGPGVEMALRGIAPFAHVFVRAGQSRSEKPTEGNDRASSLLTQGARVAGVSHAPERYLPATLVQAADLVVTIPQPNNRVVAAAIRAVTGKRVRRLPPAAAAGLDFAGITSALRMGTAPGDCVRRLRAATGALVGGDIPGDDVPDLDSLHGYRDAMSWAKDLVSDVEEWRAGKIDWKDVRRTVLFHSDPGLGKSSLVRSIAKAVRMPLVTMTVSELFVSSSGHLDGVLKALDAKLSHAAAHAPAILFMDEVDSIPNRATMDSRGRDYWSPFVAAVLTSLDSTTSGLTSNIVVIGATNHAEQLDAALIRPGRLHPVIRIPRPDAPALAGILRQHLGADLAGADLGGVAHLGVGATGADAVSWVKGARASARAEGRGMELADLVAQVAPPETRTPEELRAVSAHEAAHACAAVFLDVGSITSVSIAAGAASGGCARATLRPRAFLTRAQLEHVAVVALVGRAMDALGGLPHTGAGGGPGSDLQRATAVVLDIHTAYGLGGSLLYRHPAEAARALNDDPELRRTVEAHVMRLYAEAEAFVRERRPVIEAVAERLLTARVLSGDEVAAIIRDSHGAARAKAARTKGAQAKIAQAKTGGSHAR